MGLVPAEGKAKENVEVMTVAMEAVAKREVLVVVVAAVEGLEERERRGIGNLCCNDSQNDPKHTTRKHCFG